MSVVKQSSPLLKRRKANEPVSTISSAKCILCTDDCEEKQKNLTDEQWAGFRNLANEWSGLEGTYSHVFSGVDWESGPNGYFWHKDCKWKMANRKTLNQARTSFNRMSTSLFIDDLSCDISRIDFPSTRLNTGIIHDKDLCIGKILCNLRCELLPSSKSTYSSPYKKTKNVSSAGGLSFSCITNFH